MTADKIGYFNKISPEIFKILEEKYGYKFEGINTIERNGIKWSTHHTYSNKEKSLKIVIKQEPYYTDYGFSLFIYKIGTKEFNILYNVPYEEQDEKSGFLKKAFKDLFTSQETLNLIAGKDWKNLKKIPFK